MTGGGGRGDHQCPGGTARGRHIVSQATPFNLVRRLKGVACETSRHRWSGGTDYSGTNGPGGPFIPDMDGPGGPLVA